MGSRVLSLSSRRQLHVRSRHPSLLVHPPMLATRAALTNRTCPRTLSPPVQIRPSGNLATRMRRSVVREQRECILTSGLLEIMDITATFVGNEPEEMTRFDDPRITVENGGARTPSSSRSSRSSKPTALSGRLLVSSTSTPKEPAIASTRSTGGG